MNVWLDAIHGTLPCPGFMFRLVELTRGASRPEEARWLARPPVASINVGLAGDCLGQVLILLAGRAADCGNPDQLGPGQIELAFFGVCLAEIFVGIDVVR